MNKTHKNENGRFVFLVGVACKEDEGDFFVLVFFYAFFCFFRRNYKVISWLNYLDVILYRHFSGEKGTTN